MDGLALLVVCGLYVYLAKVVAQFIRRRMESTLAQYATIVVFVVIPTWDIIPGWLYFMHLCNNQAEMKVLKTVNLEEKYFMPNGQADGQKVGDRFKGSFISNRNFSPVFHIEMHESALQDSRTGEILGTTKEFIYRGGWLTRFILPDAMYSCRQYQYASAHMALWREAIRPKSDLGPGGN
ncbi:MAG: hypothetical protein H8K10_19675 [Nitrospira sp.]|nr:hypothetical protein [Nitrospira sp.]